jgi:beta-galactosidase
LFQPEPYCLAVNNAKPISILLAIMSNTVHPITVANGRFMQNGQPVFLLSGEIHYFRIRREDWSTHLQAARNAGLTTVSTYVPWAWHEPEPGKFDLDGHTLPERDLLGWLRACSEHGLQVIVKPGPFILAEFRGAGLPDWLLEQYGDQFCMRTRDGHKVASDGVNLFDEHYLRHVSLWYDTIMPVIREHQASSGLGADVGSGAGAGSGSGPGAGSDSGSDAGLDLGAGSGSGSGPGGPIVLMQLCNEIGVFSWLAHQADYSPQAAALFVEWTREQFVDIAEVNRIWGTDAKSFEDLALPLDGRLPYTSRGDRARDMHWHRFWRYVYARYLNHLDSMARAHGVDVPFYHNLPGWIYGQGYEFPVNITMYDELYGEQKPLLFGVDHIPEFVSHRNMHDDRIINDITRAVVGNKPMFAAEFQSGSREYHVVTSPREMALFYKASIANGLTGWNYYMFSQGRNPSRKGYSGDTFYWFTPLTAEGETTSAYPLVRQINRLVTANADVILEAERQSEVCVLFYTPYYSTELERPETGATGLHFRASDIRRGAWFDGLLKALQVMNVDYDMADLSRTNPTELSRYRQVWAFATDEMDALAQQVLVDYVQLGGHLMVFPALPNRTLSQESCSLLADALGVHECGRETIDSPLIDVAGFSDVKCANPQLIYRESDLDGAEILARTLSGAICGFIKTFEKGQVAHLGTWLGFDTEGHKPVYRWLLQRLGGRLRRADADTHQITVRQRFTGDGRGLLFVANYFHEEHLGSIVFTHPKSGLGVGMPGGHTVPLPGDDLVSGDDSLTANASASAPASASITAKSPGPGNDAPSDELKQMNAPASASANASASASGNDSASAPASASPTAKSPGPGNDATATGQLRLPALYAILTPISIPLTPNLDLLYTTSDLLDIVGVNSHSVQLVLTGDRDLNGELVLEGSGVSHVQSIHIGGVVLTPIAVEDRLRLRYSHPHNEEFVITLILS